MKYDDTLRKLSMFIVAAMCAIPSCNPSHTVILISLEYRALLAVLLHEQLKWEDIQHRMAPTAEAGYTGTLNYTDSSLISVTKQVALRSTFLCSKGGHVKYVIKGVQNGTMEEVKDGSPHRMEE